MKSIIIRQNGKKIVHLKQMKYGVESDILNDIGQIVITCIMDDNSRIKVANQSNIKK